MFCNRAQISEKRPVKETYIYEKRPVSRLIYMKRIFKKAPMVV